MSDPRTATAGSSDATGACAIHLDREAAFTCPRCGDNGCAECARRVVPTAAPICTTCWSRREERVEAMQRDDGAYVCRAALGFGILALIPFIWPAQLGALILAVVGYRRSLPGTTPRMYAVIGGVLGLVGAFGTVITLVLALSSV